jgi:hypothetical protein
METHLKNRLALSVAVAVGCMVGLIVLLRERPSPPTLAVGARAAEFAAGGEVEQSTARAAAFVTEQSGVASTLTPSARERLTALWGPVTPELEAHLGGLGIDLDAPFECPPWEQVEESVRSKIGTLPEADYQAHLDSGVRWPDSLTMDSLAEAVPVAVARAPELTDVDLAQIELLVIEDNIQLKHLALSYCDRLKLAIESNWRNGNYRASPVSTRLIPRSEHRNFYSASCAVDGWAAKVQLRADDFPEIAELHAQMLALRKARNARVLAYVDSLKQ